MSRPTPKDCITKMEIEEIIKSSEKQLQDEVCEYVCLQCCGEVIPEYLKKDITRLRTQLRVYRDLVWDMENPRFNAEANEPMPKGEEEK